VYLQAAFLLPILHNLLTGDRELLLTEGATPAPRALIVVPTRELAQQIHNEGVKFATGTNANVGVAQGGVNTRYEKQLLNRGVSILVATPGRLTQLIKTLTVCDLWIKRLHVQISLKHIETVVLDEADRMMEEGFESDIQHLLEHPDLPPRSQRQVLMFSATFPMEVRETSEKYLKVNRRSVYAAHRCLQTPVKIRIGAVGMPCQDVIQTVLSVPQTQKHDKLLELLGADIEQYNAGKGKRDAKKIIVFVERRRTAQQVACALNQEKFPAVELQGCVRICLCVAMSVRLK
jgi:superfamily II DNA/RNA helicase